MIAYLEGEAKWAKVHKPDAKYDRYTIDLYMTKDSWVAYKKLGLQLKTRENEEGEKYVTFGVARTRLIKGEAVVSSVEVLDKEGKPFKGDIGNGSKVTIKVELFDTAKGTAHRLLAVRVDDLVEYTKNKVSDDSIQLESPF